MKKKKEKKVKLIREKEKSNFWSLFFFTLVITTLFSVSFSFIPAVILGIVLGKTYSDSMIIFYIIYFPSIIFLNWIIMTYFFVKEIEGVKKVRIEEEVIIKEK